MVLQIEQPIIDLKKKFKTQTSINFKQLKIFKT